MHRFQIYVNRTCLLLFISGSLSTYGQELYPEKFSECYVGSFCLDCGDPKADLTIENLQGVVDRLNPKTLRKAKGVIIIQILVDSLGTPCLLSALNQSNVSIKKLALQEAIQNMEKWGPAKTEGKAENTSVSLEIHMNRGDVKMRRLDFNFANFTNIQSAGKPEIKGSKKSNLSVEWEVLTQSNSALPWDMTRSVTVDWENNDWITTDNGLCKITANRIQVFNAKNSPIEEKFGKSFTSNISLDSNGNIWFANSYQIIKYDQKHWSVFDNLNSPME